MCTCACVLACERERRERGERKRGEREREEAADIRSADRTALHYK